MSVGRFKVLRAGLNVCAYVAYKDLVNTSLCLTNNYNLLRHFAIDIRKLIPVAWQNKFKLLALVVDLKIDFSSFSLE